MSHYEGLSAYKNKDFTKALKIWKEEVILENDQAMTNLGLMYLKGEGVEKDFIRAREWFEKASLYDNDSANFNLGLMYQSNIGVKEDLQKAIKYLRKAVLKNHTQAAYRLALILLHDRKNLIQVKEGFSCMIQAAKNKHMMALALITSEDKSTKIEEKLNTEFRKKDFKIQLDLITEALNKFIRPILQKDGGDIILVEYINKKELEIRLVYQGACVGCSLASTGTYTLIKDLLNKLIDLKVKVLII